MAVLHKRPKTALQVSGGLAVRLQRIDVPLQRAALIETVKPALSLTLSATLAGLSPDAVQQSSRRVVLKLAPLSEEPSSEYVSHVCKKMIFTRVSLHNVGLIAVEKSHATWR